MKLGANYPKGPFEWADEIGPDRILHTLDSLRATHGDAYLAAPPLRELEIRS
jgi:3-hydroxybutyryl-CoA dehydrogenase